jgi:hypothetical protein
VRRPSLEGERSISSSGSSSSARRTMISPGAWLSSQATSSGAKPGAPGEIVVLRAEEEDPLLDVEAPRSQDGRHTIAVPSAYYS